MRQLPRRLVGITRPEHGSRYLTYEQNQRNAGTHLEIGCWQGGPREAYLPSSATLPRPGACSEGPPGQRIPRLACAFHRFAGTRDVLGVMGVKKGHPL
jgi:hypothetical protein